MLKISLFASSLFFNLCFAQLGGGLVDMEDPHKETFERYSKLKDNIYLICRYSHEFGQVKSRSGSKFNRMEKEEVQDWLKEKNNFWDKYYQGIDDYEGNKTKTIKFGRVDVDFFIISEERSKYGNTDRLIYQSKENLLWAPEDSSAKEKIIFPKGKRSFLVHDALRAKYSYNYEGLTVNMPFYLNSWSFDEGFFYFRYKSSSLDERLVLDRTDLSLQAQYRESDNCSYLGRGCDQLTFVLVSQCEIVSANGFEEAIKNEIVNRSNQLQKAKKVNERINKEKNEKEKTIQERKI